MGGAIQQFPAYIGLLGLVNAFDISFMVIDRSNVNELVHL